MRLWTLHPQYLDSRGLVALWRETLLAQQVLAGNTRGYRAHPQLHRFREHPEPLTAVAAYLHGVAEEAERRGYRFDRSRILLAPRPTLLDATSGQVRHEWEHLLAKLRARAPIIAAEHAGVDTPLAHPLFRVVPGPVAEWERGPA